jgi:hypothetical protein
VVFKLKGREECCGTCGLRVFRENILGGSNSYRRPQKAEKEGEAGEGWGNGVQGLVTM